MIEVLAQRLFSSLLGKLLVGVTAVLTSFRYGAGYMAYRATEKLERPEYTVIQKLADGVELRRYEPYLIAEATVDGVGFRGPTGAGFGKCARYIFGKNKPRGWLGGRGDGEKMAMTAPVRVEGGGQGSSAADVGEKMAMTAPVRVGGGGAGSETTRVSFVIGSKYTLRTVPKPIEDRIRLRRVPAHTLAVTTFSGPPPEDGKVGRERERIEGSLAKAGMAPKSTETLCYGYHDPFITPNFLRRNEVAVLVEGSV